VAAVAGAGPHRRMKDDEMVAHYARADDGSPGVIRIGQLAERVGSSAATTTHPRNYRTTLSRLNEDSKATPPWRDGFMPRSRLAVLGHPNGPTLK
jgi:hypothetical protein